MKFACLALLIVATYVGSYFAVLALPSAKYVIINGERMPDFHGIPSAFFAPIHAVDKQWLRHAYWHPYPRNAELSFEWLLRDVAGKPSAPDGNK